MSLDNTSDQADQAKRLEAFLGRQIPEARTIRVDKVEPIIGGYSRVMSRVSATIDGRPKGFISRADGPAGQALFDTDRQAEWDLLSALTADGSVPMPKALYYDADGSELGAKTILLELIEGEPFLKVVRGSKPEDLPKHADAMCDLMAAIHATDQGALPANVDRPTDWTTYVDSLIEQWRQVERDHAVRDPFFRYMARWLDENRPEPAPLTLVHGEFQVSNVVTDTSGAALAVDWEFAHVGDPREDIGWCRFVAAMQPPDLIGLDEERFLTRYRERSGLDETVINPLSIAYFSILPSIRVWQGFSKQQRAFVEGTNTNMMMAYSIAVLVVAHEGWMHAVKQIESALAGAAGRTA